MNNRIQHILTTVCAIGLVLIFIGLSSCAKQGYPPGGPEDRRGPMIISTDPTPDSTGVSNNIRPFFQFDEYVDRVSVEMATFVSPLPEGKIRFKWRGKSVRLIFPEPLQKDMTYVITLGTGIKDLRGNPLPWTYTLAFSTGETLDKAAISGRIYKESDLTGIQIWAFSLEQDTDPNPKTRGPDYITQADELGFFLLSHLREGIYRIFAIQDHRRNRKWDPDEDRIGVAFLDAHTARDQVSSGVDMLMSLQDTTGAWIRSVRVLDRNHLQLHFNEPVYKTPTSMISIQDSAANILHVTSFFPDPLDSVAWMLTTEIQEYKKRYFVLTSGFQDQLGNQNLPDTAIFEGSELPDTIGPHLMEFSPEDLARDVLDMPAIQILFNEEITADSCPVMTFGDLENQIPFNWETDGAALNISPKDSISNIGTVQVSVSLNSIGDPFGNHGIDSVLTWKFTLVPPDTMGKIIGQIDDEDTTATGVFILEASKLGSRESWRSSWEVDSTGIFQLDWMLPGEYQLQAFRDEDGSGDYSYGSPYPFVPSERFTFYSDTLTVRSRWETAGVVITIPPRKPYISQPIISDTTKVTP